MAFNKVKVFMEKKFEKGISIRKLCIFISMVAAVAFVITYIATINMSKKYEYMLVSISECSICEEAAQQIRSASDYLTNNARLYVINGEKEYLLNYIDEALNGKNREKAMNAIKKSMDSDIVKNAENALNESIGLMDTEYYAMRLVLESQGENLDEYPDNIKNIQLADEDASLTRDEMRYKAIKMLCGSEYVNSKNKILNFLEEYLKEILELTSENNDEASAAFKTQLRVQNVMVSVLFMLTIIIFAAIIFSMLIPIGNFERAVKAGESIRCTGSEELRNLANAYNGMYFSNDYNMRQNKELKKNNITDALTKVYNRSGYDELKQSINRSHPNLALIMLDIDRFKLINDTYGHPAGDKALQIVANTLSGLFRSNDYIFRLGGDEFAVIVTDVNIEHKSLIKRKIDHVNDILGDYQMFDGKLSISAGAAFSESGYDKELYDVADKELYRAKENGRRCCIVYGTLVK